MDTNEEIWKQPPPHVHSGCCKECQEENRQLLAEMSRLAMTTIPYLIKQKNAAEHKAQLYGIYLGLVAMGAIAVGIMVDRIAHYWK